MSKLELTLLGKPRILIDQNPLPQLTSTKAKAILFYLAVTQERCSRETLAGLLWSDMPESSARASLRVALSKLRRHVGEHLQIKRRSVKLMASANVVVDVQRFEEAAADPHTAVDLYSGPLLDDFYLRDAPLFDQWVEQERQRLHQQAINHLNQLAQEAAAAAQFEQAITYTRQLLTLEPWREESHRQLMQWLNQTGQRGAALSQFDHCRHALQKHLDAQPAAETITLYKTIKSTPSSPAANTSPTAQQNPLTAAAELPPHNLHPYPTSFIGRADELHTVTQQLQTPSCRLLTITGTGGIGKTRLALETAQRLLPSFEHGVFYIPLVSLSTSTTAVLVSTIADALNLSLHGSSDLREQLVDYLAHKQMLLVFDNFEHLLAAADLLLDLLTAAPQLKLLVTSREPLGLPEEWVLPLSGLPYKDEGQTTAAQLFSERAQRLDLSFDPAAETADIHHICTLVEGLPLAIELAAAWVRVIPCTEIAAEIERNLDFLATELRIVPDHQTSIRATFVYSWSLLPPASQTVLAKLAIFRGSFSRDAADAVAGASLRTLATLVDKSLIQKEAHGRFRIHPLIQQFALEQLSETERHTLSLTHASYYTRFLHTRQNDMYSAADPQLLTAIKTDIENIRAAWQWLLAAKDSAQTAALITQAMPLTSYYFHRRCHYQEGQSLFATLSQQQHTYPNHLIAQAQVQLASFQCLLSQYDAAEPQLTHSIPILQQADDAASAATAFYYLGFLHTRKGDYTQAIAHFKDSLALYQAIPLEKEQAQPLTGLGIVAMTDGRYDQAEAYGREALAIHRHNGYQRGIANLLSNLGSVFARQGDYAAAQQHYVAAAEAARETGEQLVTAVIISNLGSIARALGEYQTALQHYQESLLITQEMGNQRWIAANLNGLGMTYAAMDNPQAAQTTLLEALHTAAAVQALPDILTALTQLGRLFVTQKRLALAAAVLIYAAHHRSTSEITRQEAQETLTTLTEQLSQTEKDHARTQAQTWSLEEIIAAVGRSE